MNKIVIGIIIIAVLVGGYFFLNNKTEIPEVSNLSNEEIIIEDSLPPKESVPTIDEEIIETEANLEIPAEEEIGDSQIEEETPVQ